MKKLIQYSTLVCLLFTLSSVFAQKVVIIGVNHTTPDGFSFVAAEELTSADVIYFTDREYDSPSNTFASGGESIVRFTPTTTIAVGTVVFINESSTNTFTISCTGGSSCGSLVRIAGSGSFSLSTGGETYYAFDAANDATALSTTAPVSNIHSLFYTGDANTTPPSGGNVPAAFSPAINFPTAVIIDGFTFASGANRTEYLQTAPARDGVTKALLENPAQYTQGATGQALSTIPFTNFSLAGTNPNVSVSINNTSLAENNTNAATITFTISEAPAAALTVNFGVGGSAIFNSDYTVSGASTFNTTSGTVIIASGSTTATVVITPTADTDLEPLENVFLNVATGAGYDPGAPGSASTNILNDDTLEVTPLLVLTGAAHLTATPNQDGISFVAADVVPGGTQVYFTDSNFNINTLEFTGTEGLFLYTAPAGGLTKGTVIVATETSSGGNAFTLICNGLAGGCGTMTAIGGNSVNFATVGESFSSFTDTDSDPTNGITALYSTLHTVTGAIAPEQNPTAIYTGSVLVDGFGAADPNKMEYRPSLRTNPVDLSNFTNTGNWDYGTAAGVLSDTPFGNINIIPSGNPSVTVAASPTAVLEDSGTGMVYTFTMSEASVGDTVINFDVTGTATFTSDYTATGATSFTAASGSATIADGTSSVSITVTPVVDTTLEIQESVELTIASGTGYDAGSPNMATTLINNDDTSMSEPLVAIVGMNHLPNDGFSFVAVQDLTAGELIYFTEKEFDNTTLFFNSGEAVFSYEVPAAGLPTGDVVVITEISSGVYSLNCNGASGASCGVFTQITPGSSLSLGSTGETIYAYSDSDSDPENGITEIYAAMHTTDGLTIPAMDDPRAIFPLALVIDGFGTTAPDRTEYDPANRATTVDKDNLINVSNWLVGQTSAALSAVPFADINVLSAPPEAMCQDAGPFDLGADGTTNISPSVIDNGSTATPGPLYLGLETTAFIVDANASGADNLDGNIYHTNFSEVMVSTTGSYHFSPSNIQGGATLSVAILYDQVPVPNSGTFNTRPGFLGFVSYNSDGSFNTGIGVGNANGLNMVGLTTYYVQIFSATPTQDMIATINTNAPVISTNQKVYTCADIGVHAETLYAFDDDSNIDTCTANITIAGTVREYTAGGWTGGNQPDMGSLVMVNSDYDSAIEGDIEGCACEVDNNATLTIKAGNYLHTDGDITVNTGASLIVEHQGSVVQNKDDATVTNNGTINVNLTTPELNGRDFMLLGSPMTAETQAGVLGSAIRVRNHETGNFTPNAAVAATSPGAGNWVDEEGDDWINYTGALNPAEGFMYIPSLDILPGPTFPTYDLTFEQGTLNNGVNTYTAGFNTDQNSSPNIIANPYASAISAVDFINANNTIVDAVYFWEHATTPTTLIPGPYYVDYSMEDVSTYNLLGGTAAASDASTTPNGIIASGQGFGLKALQGGNITFNNAMRRTTGNTTLRTPESPENRIWLSVTNEFYNVGNSNLIGFTQNSTSNFDLGYDATRMATLVSLFSHLEDGSEALTIQGRELFNEEMQIPMGFSSLIQEDLLYTISIKQLEGIAISEATVFLVDHVTETITNLSETSYTFTSNHGVQNSRFTLQFVDDEALSSTDNALEAISLYPNPTQGIVTISSPKSAITGISVTDIRGRQIQNVAVSLENRATIDISTFGAAVYFVTITTEEGILTKRIIKN